MRRWTLPGALALSMALPALLPVGAAEPAGDAARLAELRRKPITADRGEIGKLLAQWWKDGTAAGNAGDFYDNRDGGHSDLDTAPYPQLQRIVYSADDIKSYRHWALTVATRPHVTFGNSSTSAPPTMGGSNPRHAYCSPRGLQLLAEQYRGNNIYIYPEHRDHDPGHNGHGDGFGDLYPTNTPYLIVSQGSSGSDQPFMHAIPFTLAAFRPEVKKKLVESGLLMPTLQMILRSTNKQLGNPKDYLTGKAHPTVFEGSWVDALRMVKLAHDMTAETIPPLVRLKVLEQDTPVNGRDFFDPPGITEKLADTPAVVARIWRGRDGHRRLVVSAADSFDPNKKPLTFTWVVLRGDDKQIKITPRNKEGSEVEIVVRYPGRRPVAPGAALESNRIDIGVFVHNGAYYSAPGFITFYGLDNEGRAYDDKGRILEIGYGAGEVEVRMSEPTVLLNLMSAAGLAEKVLRLTAAQRAALEKAGALYEERHRPLKNAQGESAAAARDSAKRAADLKNAQTRLEKARKANADNPSAQAKIELETAAKEVAEAKVIHQEAEAILKKTQQVAAELQKKLDEVLAANRPDLGASLSDFVNNTLRRAWQDAALFDTFQKELAAARDQGSAEHRNAVDAARQRLVQSGLAAGGKGGGLDWHPLRGGSGPLADRLTPYERFLVQQFNAALLAELVLPGAVTATSPPNYVDHRLFSPKSWRDIYHYDPAGRLTGWTRRNGSDVTDFTAEGLMVLEKDSEGRPIKVQSVRYRQAPAKESWRPNALEASPGDEIVTYGYEGGQRVEKSRSRANQEK